MNNYFYRKNSRLKNYNYMMAGYYFITVCTKEKQHYFGEIINGKMSLNNIGNLAYKNIENLEKTYKTVGVDKFVIMPNHIHLILILNKENNLSISRIIKHYKEGITKKIGKSIWQKSFYDHIIRNKKDYLRIWKYIDENILNWSLDKYNK